MCVTWQENQWEALECYQIFICMERWDGELAIGSFFLIVWSHVCNWKQWKPRADKISSTVMRTVRIKQSLFTDVSSPAWRACAKFVRVKWCNTSSLVGFSPLGCGSVQNSFLCHWFPATAQLAHLSWDDVACDGTGSNNRMSGIVPCTCP